MKREGLTFIEVVVAAVVLSMVMIATIDFMSSFVKAEAIFNNSINSKQDTLSISERISDNIRPSSYIYKDSLTLTIPTQSSITTVINGENSIILLVPEFNADGTLIMPSLNVTKFSGIAFSIIPRQSWDGQRSSKYVLVQTNYNGSDLNIPTDPNDPISVMQAPTLNWSGGSSYILADNLKPAIFSTMSDNAFNISSTRDSVTFAFVSNADGTYFPSSNGGITVNDSKYLTNVVLRNWRNTNY